MSQPTSENPGILVDDVRNPIPGAGPNQSDPDAYEPPVPSRYLRTRESGKRRSGLPRRSREGGGCLFIDKEADERTSLYEGGGVFLDFLVVYVCSRHPL